MSLPSPASPASDRAEAQAQLNAYYSWLNAPWTDDDAPYAAIRISVDKAVAKAAKPSEIVQDYKRKFINSPANAKLLFAYCYFAFKSSETPNGISKSQFQSEYDNFYTANSDRRLSLPHAYNYIRLAFLGDSHYNSNSPFLTPLGKRLVKHSPEDADVQYALAKLLTYSDSSADRSLGAKYQQELAQRFPADPRTYYLLGSIHYRRAWLTHSQAEADLSIAAYQRSYKLSPQDKATQREGEITIKFVEDLKAKWKFAG